MPRAFLVKNRKEDGSEEGEEEMVTDSPGSAFTIVKPKHQSQLQEGMSCLFVNIPAQYLTHFNC